MDSAKKRTLGCIAAVAVVGTLAAGCSGGTSNADGKDGSQGGTVTIEFQQWWESEMPAGSLRKIMDGFEAANPGIKVKLLSGPFDSTKEQDVAGAAAGTMADVVALDGAWVSDFAKQGAIADLSTLMKQAGYDPSDLVSQVQSNGKTYMLPVANFVYPMFINQDLLSKAGISTPPSTRDDFSAAAKAVSALGGDASGWVLPLSQEDPNGIQNDVMSWVWAAGGSMLKDGKPDVDNPQVKSAVEYVKSLWDAGAILPGSFTMKEQDKVEQFTNGRVGMMIDSLAHITTIKQANPNLNFTVSAVPTVAGFSGTRGIPYASWGIGVAQDSKHKDAAWKLVQYLMSKDVNSKLATEANAFPGNKTSQPDFTNTDPLFKQAFDIYKAGQPTNEFIGLPVSDQLMRQFDVELQKVLSGSESVDSALSKVQSEWTKEF